MTLKLTDEFSAPTAVSLLCEAPDKGVPTLEMLGLPRLTGGDSFGILDVGLCSSTIVGQTL